MYDPSDPSLQDEWWIFRNPKALSNIVNDSVVGKQFGAGGGVTDMFINVNATVNYVPAHLRKLIRLIGANAQYVFTAAVTPPIGYVFRVTNFGAYSSITPVPKVKFENALLLWGNTSKSEIEIPLYATYEFCFDGTS